MASTAQAVANRIDRRSLAQIYLTAVCAAGVVMAAIALAVGNVPAALLPVSAAAFVLGAMDLSVGISAGQRSVSVRTSHFIVLASSVSFGPIAGTLPAVFVGLGRLTCPGGVGSGPKYTTLMAAPASAAASGWAFRVSGGGTFALAAHWPFVALLVAALAYAAVHASVGLASAAHTQPRIAEETAVTEYAQPETACKEEPLDESEGKTELLDALTGAANLRYLMMFLNQEISRSSRTGQPMSVILIDVDNLDRVNNEKGREAGDGLLKEAAYVLKGVLRDYDLVARYSDDEFAVVLPQTFSENAFEIAERIHNLLTHREYDDYREGTFAVSVSIGIASFPDYGGTADELISSAHHALNRAKFSGQNRICSCHRLAKAG